MDANFACYIAQLLAAVLFALICEYLLKRRYEEARLVWLVATVGIAQVGLIVAARLSLAPVPSLVGAEAAWWTWWLIFWSFLAAAVPIWLWQIAIQWRHISTLLRFIWRRTTSS